ncbi:uncharacterized protein LOC106641867 [Copidosoma floridanum]|uniref:uncharacterized protein LOC106641867 n=1 Tax=Copidosoma floridanum TaxID=29053 RepID=UPI0006C9CBC3|nr:uncharacterized protein LOC106641867 [Copidosoma floridanum]XP_014211926.1 uncharacterized protein LOC106641867 [Copidosoma floridanum]
MEPDLEKGIDSNITNKKKSPHTDELDPQLVQKKVLQQEQSTDDTFSQQQKACQTFLPLAQNSWRPIKTSTMTATSTSAATNIRIPLTATVASKSLSSQVMEYYEKYSQNSNLNQYFSLPTSMCNTADCAKYYYSIYELTPKYVTGRQGCIGQDHGVKSCIPKERRRWARPPLIGQSSSADESLYLKQSMTESQSLCHISPQDQDQELRNQQQSSSTISAEALVVTKEKTSGYQESVTSHSERKTSASPTSSIASHKPLEWDSGADVGYLYAAATSSSNGALSAQRFQKLSTLERMALTRGCSAALRLDPEGTTGQQQSPGSSNSAIHTTVTATVLSLMTTQKTEGKSSNISNNGELRASSTPVLGNASGSESEIEITPVVKNHLTGIVIEDDIGSELPNDKYRRDLSKDNSDFNETPKSSSHAFKLPYAFKYSNGDSELQPKEQASISICNCLPDESGQHRAKSSAYPSRRKQPATTGEKTEEKRPLKKSSSMNLLESSSTKFLLKRSQSELNLFGLNEKAAQRPIFHSSSSIATVVNNHHKPTTCDKFIQTSMRACDRESIGIQVSVLTEEEKLPPLTRATSLAPRSVQPIVKSAYNILHPKAPCVRKKSEEEDQNKKETDSSFDSSRTVSLTPHADNTENVTGQANSFEYFPGHIYENVPNVSSSHVSTIDTGRSNSTMPNTSSSIDEKLWGDSDSLVRDLERSVSILKSLLDANKFNKPVKSRLIHHVVKRLRNAQYAENDTIEHNLEDNVPWNPDDARSKVYRAEIIQALVKNTTDSSDDWKPAREQKKKNLKKLAPTKEARDMKEIINMSATIESSNSDNFDRNIDQTEMDGRKARMGLRTDDCSRRGRFNTPTNKSESSECFLPQRGRKKNKMLKDIFITSTSNSSAQNQNRVLLNAVVNNRQSPIESSSEAGNSVNWRLPVTASERKYEIRQRDISTSDSIDSKVVNYVEMEKRNQLIWITNEITHLSNLKKLLEQEPKSKTERSSNSSTPKSKPSDLKPLKSLPASRDHYYLQNVNESQLNRNWSSHCNLIKCPLSAMSANVRRLKKRNSCTQTDSDNSFAYSKSSSEIVSARIQSPNTKLTNVCVQTSGILPQVSTVCQVYQFQPNYPCVSGERACPQCLFKNPPVPLYQLHSSNNAECMKNDLEGAKEVFNHSSARQLKCACKTDCESKTDGIPKYTTAANETCNHHFCEDSTCSCSRCRLTGSLETSQSQKDCDCEDQKIVHNFECMHIKKLPMKELLDKATGTTDLVCQCTKSKGAQMSQRLDCSYHSNKKSSPYFLNVPSEEVKNHQEIHNCRINPKDREKSSLSPKPSSLTKSLTLPNSQVCRVCGTLYQNKQNCHCISKSYPKGVAYELSFINDGKANIEINGMNRNNEARAGPRCECSGFQMRYCNCKKKKAKQYSLKRKHTLQEYLISNNPTFADNVEIRRHYVSEIQRMRELRKERKVQLLAMATTTNIFTSPHLTRKCPHKKLTDNEIKVRLRKRYCQLPEIRAKRLQQQLQKETRRNRLMAKIFCKKLQQRVLKGQVDLSQSVSVISNL